VPDLKLASGSCSLFFGRAADVFGRRLVLLFGMACYARCLLIAMYVMSSLPVAQQSAAGGLFNAVMRLSSIVGLGASTAIFNGVDGSGPDGGQVLSDCVKYRATFVALAGTAFSIFLLPFVSIRNQGERDEGGNR
jgi:MFS family permease